MDIFTPTKIVPIHTLKDNYVWTIVDNQQHTSIIVDPGEATRVMDYLNQHELTLLAILVTHHHWDHTNGIAEIVNHFDVPVFGPDNERIPNVTRLASIDKIVKVAGFPIEFQIIEIPGHTRGHIAYYSPGIVFCGDTLFSAGCGKLFEGTAEQMYTSLQKLAALPDDTKVYCAHEYTLKNLEFARLVEPNNLKIAERIQQVTELRDINLPSLPSTIKQEKETNPFLRCNIPEVKAHVEKHHYNYLNDPIAVFAALRKWKDNF